MGKGRLKWSNISYNRYQMVGSDGMKIGDSSSSFVPSGGAITTYFNSLEPGGNGSNPNIIFADDFNRGYWFLTYESLNPTPLNAGWNGTPFGEADPQGTNFGRAGQGIGGGYCATNGGHTGIGQARGMADHSMSQSVTELYYRYYVKPLPGYLFGQEKALTFNKGPAGIGGIYAGTLFFGLGDGTQTSVAPTFLSVNQDTNLGQNQGNTLSMTGGNWYYIEMHLKFNSAGTDVLDMWMDDCGPTGLTGPSTPTLRMHYTNCTLRPSGDSSPSIGSVWTENWANPAATGEMYYDQIMVSKVGPIGHFVP